MLSPFNLVSTNLVSCRSISRSAVRNDVKISFQLAWRFWSRALAWFFFFPISILSRSDFTPVSMRDGLWYVASYIWTSSFYKDELHHALISYGSFESDLHTCSIVSSNVNGLEVNAFPVPLFQKMTSNFLQVGPPGRGEELKECDCEPWSLPSNFSIHDFRAMLTQSEYNNNRLSNDVAIVWEQCLYHKVLQTLMWSCWKYISFQKLTTWFYRPWHLPRCLERQKMFPGL